MFGNKPNERSNPNWTNVNWLKSRFHFSFAEYSNHRNTGFGVLRVMNDDLVQPSRGLLVSLTKFVGPFLYIWCTSSGFGTHPHRDAEICTYVVDGFLTHKDSMGTEESIGRGAIQFMVCFVFSSSSFVFIWLLPQTAGSGITHSEHNLHTTDPLRFIQIWMNPRSRGLKPNYGSFNSPCADRHNQWWEKITVDLFCFFEMSCSPPFQGSFSLRCWVSHCHTH